MNSITPEGNNFVLNLDGEKWKINASVFHLPIIKIDGDPFRESLVKELIVLVKDGKFIFRIGDRTFSSPDKINLTE